MIVNVDENRSIARGLLSGCLLALVLSVAVQTVCQDGKKQLGYVLQQHTARVSILMTNQQQLNQTMQVNPGDYGPMHVNQSSYQWQQQHLQPNPYHMPQTNFNVMPPPPSYYSATGDAAYPPPQASFPKQEY